MKAGKATGKDNIPAEVWQRSAVAQDELFKFIKQVWRKESVPANLAVCIFVMIFKRKGSHNDCSKYRAIGLLNHTYKIMSVILLKRIVEECADFLSEWQAGFRANRGCRDNILLLRMLYDYIIAKKESCIVTFIDYTAAFDSISHKFMDATLAKAGASRKSRAIFRAIYAAATGAARVRSTDGEFIYSGSFNIGRGVIQGDIISPILFIIALDQLMQEYDKDSEGVKCGRILKLKILGYADDAALIDGEVNSMTRRLTSIADASEAQTDMKMNMAKTFTQHVFKRDEIKVTSAEAAAAEAGFKHKCDFCPRRFKTQRHMLIHRANCNHNYGTTDEVFEVEDIARWRFWQQHCAMVQGKVEGLRRA